MGKIFYLDNDGVMVPSVGARVYNSASLTIPNGSWTALTFDSERYDTDTIHDTVTNNSRLTCKTAGKYVMFGTFFFAADATERRAIGIYLNGTTWISWSQLSATPSGVWAATVSCIYKLAVNEYVELKAWQNTGGDLVVVLAGNYSPEFAMQRIG